MSWCRWRPFLRPSLISRSMNRLDSAGRLLASVFFCRHKAGHSLPVSNQSPVWVLDSPPGRRSAGRRPPSCSSPRRTRTAACPPRCSPPAPPYRGTRAAGSPACSSGLGPARAGSGGGADRGRRGQQENTVSQFDAKDLRMKTDLKVSIAMVTAPTGGGAARCHHHHHLLTSEAPPPALTDED